MDARIACGVAETAAQIQWLLAKFADYSPNRQAGDWATENATGDAGSSSSKRAISDKANQSAILAALRYLGHTDIGQRPGIIIPTFGGITN